MPTWGTRVPQAPEFRRTDDLADTSLESEGGHPLFLTAVGRSDLSERLKRTRFGFDVVEANALQHLSKGSLQTEPLV